MGFVKVVDRKQYIPINRIVDVYYLDDRIYVKVEGGHTYEVEQTGGRMNRYKLEDITFYTLPEDIQPVFGGEINMFGKLKLKLIEKLIGPHIHVNKGRVKLYGKLPDLLVMMIAIERALHNEGCDTLELWSAIRDLCETVAGKGVLDGVLTEEE